MRVRMFAIVGVVLATLLFGSWAVAATPVSKTASTNKKKIVNASEIRRARAKKTNSIQNYFLLLADGNRKTAKRFRSQVRPQQLYRYVDGTDNPGSGSNDSSVPDKLTPAQWLAAAPRGPVYVMANWWCSAAAVKLFYVPDGTTEKSLGTFSGDCTNPNAGITGTFYPQRLGVFDPNVQLRFRLDDIDPVEEVLHSNLSDVPSVCNVDYYRGFGHPKVYAAQFTCDDGKFIGSARDDFQFTVYVFPANWPEQANIEAVLKNMDGDEDRDGLLRKVEVLIGTNPRDKDTDNDGLNDGDEYIAYETSPLVKDTDGDGYNDRTEVATKNNPLGPGKATADQLARWDRLKYRKAPTIKNLAVSVTGTLATVSWSTDIDADGIVNWGPTAAYGKYRSNFAFRKSQSISFTVLPGVEYHYAVRACSTAPSPRCTTSADAVFGVPAATAGPVISDVVVDQTYGYATVRWTVDPAADGIVNYGSSDAYGTYKNSTTFKGSHSISFAVTPGQTYHYAIRSCTVGAVCTTTPDATFTSTANAVGPTLGPITVGFNGSIATVSWATDIAADGIVNYGPTDAYGTHVSSFPFATTHAIQFSIAPATTYHYAVRSCTQGGLCTTSADATFTTP